MDVVEITIYSARMNQSGYEDFSSGSGYNPDAVKISTLFRYSSLMARK